jgi:hypothetical protein
MRSCATCARPYASADSSEIAARRYPTRDRRGDSRSCQPAKTAPPRPLRASVAPGWKRPRQGAKQRWQERRCEGERSVLARFVDAFAYPTAQPAAPQGTPTRRSRATWRFPRCCKSRIAIASGRIGNRFAVRSQAWPVPCFWGNAGSWLLQPVPLWLRRHFQRASDPAQGSAGACRRRQFRSHLATSAAGFELVRRCRFVRPQRLLGCGSRSEAWRGSRRRGWRRCWGSARGLARSRGCFCRWPVA